MTSDCNVPVTWDEEVTVGKHPDHAGNGSEYEHYDTTREMLDAIRGGRSKLVPKAVTVPTAADPSDLEAINRHRRSLGMEPIDLEAGWTAEELARMADTIRREGRMLNPKALKRRLLR